MKKTAVLIIALTALLLTGCNKAIPAEEAGELFIDRLVYQERTNEFADAFEDGVKTGEKLDKNAEKFEDDFLEGLLASEEDVSERDVTGLTQELLKQMREKTTFKVAGIKEEKDAATITYFITGLDLVNAVKEMTRTLIKEASEAAEASDEELDGEETLQSAITIFTERIQVIKIENDSIEMDLTLKKEKGKWFIPKDQEEVVSNIFMAFISGTEKPEELDEALNEVTDEVMNEMLNDLYSQPALDENTSDDDLKDAVDDLLKEAQESTEESSTQESSTQPSN
ncbi:DUF5105 domain-containing protein [Candidatus Enterococcus clewellii]|uniref:DUF5105 domain-containing protein n=1 Tax=Candidatus Enterococcus clewellii TaxID=1834193 RepID=A0A242K4D9_9ENTE|nr:DUF5105 domain-containing protein [Enterococcus sp. 9E7_DIV0242]OTP14303.1 hypothetical protein A5888_002404 [Enterococcus sp. 9E7_DIV0242]